jgi:hypothetical protein
MEFLEEQTQILNDIGRSLIEATPEHWRSALLELRTTHPTLATVGLTLIISSPEGFRDLVGPTDDLQDASTRLQLLSEREGRPFTAVRFSISCDSAGQWKFNTTWDYV